MTKFDVLKHDIWSEGIKLDKLLGYGNDFLIGEGRSVAAEYPAKVTYTVDQRSVTRPGPERSGPEGKTRRASRSPTRCEICTGGSSRQPS